MNVIIPTATLFIAFIITIVVSKRLLTDYLRKQLIIKEHEKYHLLLNYYLELAYDSVWKDQMMVYINNGVKPSREDIETMARNFSKLVSHMLGPNISNYFIEFHGSEETFWTNIITYFNFKVDNDELENFINKVRTNREKGTTE